METSRYYLFITYLLNWCHPGGEMWRMSSDVVRKCAAIRLTAAVALMLVCVVRFPRFVALAGPET